MMRNPLLQMAQESPVLALFDRGVRQSDDRDLIGVTPSGVDFDLHFKRLHTDDRSRIKF
jgi:hypothetical protein